MRAEMRRGLRPDWLLLVSTRADDDLLRGRPTSTLPPVHRNVDRTGSKRRTVAFQLWCGLGSASPPVLGDRALSPSMMTVRYV
ncbi:hypothetical protein [Streptomyces sp. NPDC001880]